MVKIVRQKREIIWFGPIVCYYAGRRGTQTQGWNGGWGCMESCTHRLQKRRVKEMSESRMENERMNDARTIKERERQRNLIR